MKPIYILFCLICFIYSKETESNCTFTATFSDSKISLNDCKSISVAEGEQCCVGVFANVGKNQYFCESFKEDATEQDINNKLNTDVIELNRKLFPGAFIKAKASCESDVEPYPLNKCTAEDSQRFNNLDNCTNYKKDSDSNYCCLFSAKLLNSDDIYFCEEIDKSKTSDMDKTSKEIDAKYEMTDIQYKICSPEIDPDDGGKKDYSTKLYLNLVLFAYSLILLI